MRIAAMGAGGVQTNVGAEPARLRARAEQLGMYVEAFLSLPRNGDAASFEKSAELCPGASMVRR